MGSPAGMAIAAITLMLWILWSDSVRSRKPSAPLYLMRIVLYLVLGTVLMMNLVRFLPTYSLTARVFTVLAALTSIGGAAFFAIRLRRR